MQITVLSQVVFKKGGIPTNTPRGNGRFQVVSTWNPRGVFRVVRRVSNQISSSRMKTHQSLVIYG